MEAAMGDLTLVESFEVHDQLRAPECRNVIIAECVTPETPTGERRYAGFVRRFLHPSATCPKPDGA